MQNEIKTKACTTVAFRDWRVMTKSYKYLGIDIGTTSMKAAVFDKAGNRLALRTVDYTLDTDAVTGYIEFDAKK